MSSQSFDGLSNSSLNDLSSVGWERLLSTELQATVSEQDREVIVDMIAQRVFSAQGKQEAPLPKQWEDPEIRLAAAKLFFEDSLNLPSGDALVRLLAILNLNPSQRFSLVKFLSKTNPFLVVENLLAFDLNDEQRFEIAKICTKTSPRSISWIKNFKLTTQQLHALASLLLGTSLSQDRLFAHLEDFEIGGDLVAAINQSFDKLRSPEIKSLLLGCCLCCICDQKIKSKYDQIISGLRHKDYYSSHSEFMILCSLIAFSTDKGIVEESLMNAFRDCFFGYVKKDPMKLKQLLFVLSHILYHKSLSTSDKSQVFSKLLKTPKENIPNTLHNMRILCSLERFSDLLSDKLPSEDLFPDISESQLFSLFSEDRISNPHLLFGATLHSHDQKNSTEYLQLFRDCILSISNGTYYQNRYSLESNIHLQTIQAYNPNLLKLWREPCPIASEPDADFNFVDTDHPEDLLLFGTEIPTCQSITAENANYSSGLLGALMHGQTRLLCAKDKKNGKIIARVIIRLLWDGTKPVLFLEPFYGNSFFNETIEQLALDKAKTMGLNLTSCRSNDFDLPLCGTLKSLGGFAPEYSDSSANRINQNGCFEILNAHIIS